MKQSLLSPPEKDVPRPSLWTDCKRAGAGLCSSSSMCLMRAGNNLMLSNDFHSKDDRFISVLSEPNKLTLAVMV